MKRLGFPRGVGGALLLAVFGFLCIFSDVYSQSLEDALSAASPSVSASNGYLVLGYYQLKNTPFDYYFQSSVDLAHWTTPNNPNAVYAVDDGAAWFNTIADTTPMISGSARFLRLSIFDPTNVTDFLFPPTNLSVTLPPGGATYAALVWSDNTMIETGYAILRETGTSGDFQEIATVGPDVTHYSDYAVQGSTTYTYEVEAFDSNEQSAPSNQASVTTLLDSNGDGIADIYKPLYGIDQNDGTDSAGGSGLSDGWLVQNGLNPLSIVNADIDLIGKGWTLADDYAFGTNPNKIDTDGDGVPDCEDEYPLDPNRSQDIPTPPMASVDTSSGVATSNVTAEAMDDQGNVGFGFVSGSDGYGNPTTYSTYVWTSGSASLSQAVSLSVNGSIRTVSYVTPDGSALGWDGVGITSYESQGGNVTDIYPPEPLFGPVLPATAGGSTPLGGSASGPYFTIYGVVNDSVYWGTIWGAVSSGSSTYDPYQFNSAVYNGGHWTLFNPQLSQDTSASIPSDVTVIDAVFNITAVTGSGYAIGSGEDYYSGLSGFLFWDGKKFAQLPGSPSGVNTSGQVVGTTGTTGTTSGYLWTTDTDGGGSSISVQSLLPYVYQNQIRNVQPTRISDPDSKNAGAIQIFFTADSLQGRGMGTWQSGEEFMVTDYPGNTTANTLVSYAGFAGGQVDPSGASASPTYDQTSRLTQAIQEGPANFELRDAFDVVSGWDDTDIQTDSRRPDPWISVAVGGTNSIACLITSATSGMELAVNPGDEQVATFTSGTTLAITGTCTNIDVIGKTVGNARILLRQKSNGVVSGSMNVDVLEPQTVTVDVYRLVDSNNVAKTTIPAPGSTGQYGGIVVNGDDLPNILTINGIQDQSQVSFAIGTIQTLSVPNWSDTNGNLAAPASYGGNVAAISGSAPANGHLHIFLVNHITFPNVQPGEDALGVTYGTHGCFCDADAPVLVFCHEVGHALGLSTRDATTKHDDQPWPVEFRLISNGKPEVGLMYPIVDHANGWLRQPDWDKANAEAKSQFPETFP